MHKVILLSLLSFISWQARAGSKIDLMVGYFSLEAEVSGGKSSVSNPSAFYLGYLKPISEKIEIKLGYSLLLADFAGSDMGYGLNAGLNYFPLHSAQEEKFKSENIEVFRFENYKPFLSAGFVQRNFESVRTSYGGFGIGVGVEKFHTKELNFKGEIRYNQLAGPSQAKATEIDVFLGVVYKI